MKPYFETELGKLYHGDCLEVMPELAARADLVFTDPPYNCGKDYGEVTDLREDYDGFVDEICTNIKAISDKFCIVVPTRELGLWTYNLRGGWIVGLAARASNAIRRGWENKLTLIWTNIQPDNRQPNLWSDIRLRGEGYFFTEDTFDHPGYTPLKLTERVINLSEFVLVFDPFMGVGTTAVACEKLNRRWIGIEISEEYCELSAKRIEVVVNQGDLFTGNIKKLK